MPKSTVKFSFDEGAIKRAAQKAVDEMGRKLDRMAREMKDRYAGRPVEEIKPVLRSRWKRITGGDLTDPHLTKVAEQISAGGEVRFPVERIR